MKFEPFNIEDVVTKASVDTDLSKVEGHKSFIKKHYNGINLHGNKKQSDKEALIRKTVNTTLQILYDKAFFLKFDNAD